MIEAIVFVKPAFRYVDIVKLRLHFKKKIRTVHGLPSQPQQEEGREAATVSDARSIA